MSAEEEPANPDPFIAPLWQDLDVLRSAGFLSEGVRSHLTVGVRMTIVPLPDGLVGLVMPNNTSAPFCVFDARSIIGRRVTTNRGEGAIIGVDVGPNGMRATIRLKAGGGVRLDMLSDDFTFMVG